MLTQFFKSINWVDVSLVILSVRVVFISVKNGFVTEVFKFLGLVCALFVSLHYYAYLAALAAKKTTLPEESWQFLIFAGLIVAVTAVFKFVRDAILMLFKVETTHQGFDKYAAGLLGAGRAIFLSSLVIFGLLLVNREPIQRETLSSYGYKVTAKAAPNTYMFLFYNFVQKLFEGEILNPDIFTVVSGQHGTHSQ